MNNDNSGLQCPKCGSDLIEGSPTFGDEMEGDVYEYCCGTSQLCLYGDFQDLTISDYCCNRQAEAKDLKITELNIKLENSERVLNQALKLCIDGRVSLSLITKQYLQNIEDIIEDCLINHYNKRR